MNGPPVDGWECPVCAYLVTDAEYLTIVFDPDCPGCGIRKWSEFRFVQAIAEEGG